MKPIQPAIIAELSAMSGISDADVQRELRSAWEALRADSKLRASARQAGLDLEVVDSHPFPPLAAERPNAQFGIAETILISVAGGVLTQVAKNALDALWTKVVWPRLQRRFGADLELKADAGRG